MNFKQTCLAASCAAMFAPAATVYAPAAFAAVTPLACDLTSAASRVNTCAPEAKMFIAGSSALGGALTQVVPLDLFDLANSTFPLTKISDVSAGNQGLGLGGTGGAGAVSAWYGMSKASLTGGTSKRLFVVYNNNNGSAAGVSQLLAKLGKTASTTIAESVVVTVGPTKNVANTCAANATRNAAADTVLGIPAMLNVDCATSAPTMADIAISDTHPTELYKLYALATAKLTTLTNSPLSMQGFGLAVNPNLYEALVNQNIADGILPSSCAAGANGIANATGNPGTATAACQPSIRSVDYTSLVSRLGTIKSASALLGTNVGGTVTDNSTAVLTLARRDALSGTQASSNIQFANNACGNNVVGTKTIAGILGGKLDVISNGTDAATGAGATDDSTASLAILAAISSGAVRSALNSTSGYSIGAIALTTPGTADKYKFIKIDGVSPNFMPKSDGSYAASYKMREAMLNGSWKFQMQAWAAVKTKADKGSIGEAFPAAVASVITGLNDSTLHDLTAIGYLDGATDNPATPKQSKVRRHLANNCSPLIKAAS